jgi:hypothetical protein
MEQPDKETIDKWHRWFAVECNNRAWDLAAAAGRSPEEDREMLDTAHASAFHWAKVGRPVNGMRAELLLANVHALLGHGAEALSYARRCLAFCEGNECEEWDVAFSHVQMALAAAVAGERELHAKHYATARQLGSALQEEADRKVFAGEFSRIPGTVRA